MQVAYEVLHLLSDGKFHSGTLLAQHLGVSRSSIWKGIAFLRKLELPIQSVTGRGYRWFAPTELLHKKTIMAALTPKAQECLGRLDVVNVVTSTNDYLIQRLAHGIPSGTVCVAEGQTAGRGRMGRQWRSPIAANIYLSLYWRLPTKLHDLSGLSLIAGLAVLEALKSLVILPPDLGIKWPNDIWYQSAKLAGILTESIGCGNTTDVIIGIGLNVSMPSAEKSNPLWTSLENIFGITLSRNQLIAQILNVLVDLLDCFQQQGFAAFMPLWADYDLLFNKTIQLSHEQLTQVGIAKGVNQRGELCVQMGDTMKAIRSGEVSVRPQEKVIA